MANNGLQEWPQALSDPAQLHIRKQYARVVVHPSFDAIKSARYIEVLTAAFGDPTEGDGKLWWDLPALTDADKPSTIEHTIRLLESRRLGHTSCVLAPRALIQNPNGRGPKP